MSGRHRRTRSRGGSAIAVAVALIVVVGGSFAAYRQVMQAGCSGEAPLVVAAAPDVAPAVAAVAEKMNSERVEVGGACVAITVTSAEPAEVAAIVADEVGTTLNGIGQADGSSVVPDVWIPDSSTWLLRLSASAPFVVPDARSIARSPVVLAMPEPIAETFGWPKAELTWPALLQQMTTSTKLHVGIVEPTRDAASLSGLLALAQAASASGDAQSATTAALRTLANGRSALQQELLAKFPRSTDPASIASGLSVAALSEQAVIAYNKKKPPIKLAALYLEPAPLALDYPYAVLPGTDPTRAVVANSLRERLVTPEFRDSLGEAGLRGGDGTVSATFTPPAGAPDKAITPSAAPTTADAGLDPAVVDRALSTWTAITLPARMLAVIDVSGSMLYKVPTAKNATRAQVTKEAARRGLGLFDDSWAVGLWIFSTELDGKKDYKELVPIGPLTTNRSQLLGQLGAIEPKPTGDTGLYDTIFAGYQAVQRDWDPGRVNSLVVLTDGDNDDPKGGLSLKQLQDKLKEVADPKQPIQVIIIGIGNVNADPLKSVTKVTGGGVFVTEDPAKIGDIFLKAVSLRTSTPQ